MNNHRYRWCVVSSCNNTNHKNPEKLFISVPMEIEMRNVWLRLARRDPKSLSIKSRLYLCEDHFNLEEDMENYVEYKIMGSIKYIKMRAGVTPSRFSWVEHRHEAPSEHESAVTHIQRLDLLLEAATNVIEKRYTEPLASTSHSDVEIVDQVMDKAVQVQILPRGFKAVQANIVPHFRSKAIQCKARTRDMGTYPMDVTEPHRKRSIMISEDQTSSISTDVQRRYQQSNIPEGKVVILRVYQYLQTEYEQLKTFTGNSAHVSALSDIVERTARATGVSEDTLKALLDDEKQHYPADSNLSKRRKIYHDHDYFSCVSPIREQEQSDSEQCEHQHSASTEHDTLYHSQAESYVYQAQTSTQDMDEDTEEPEVFHPKEEHIDIEEDPLNIHRSRLTVAGVCTSEMYIKTEPPDEHTTHDCGDSDEVKREPTDDTSVTPASTSTAHAAATLSPTTVHCRYHSPTNKYILLTTTSNTQPYERTEDRQLTFS